MSSIESDGKIHRTQGDPDNSDKTTQSNPVTEPPVLQVDEEIKNTLDETESQEKDRVFRERHNLPLDEVFEYQRNGNDPGKILIFNQETFSDKSDTRYGSRKDVFDIITAFQRLGFNIHEDDVCTDRSVEGIKQKLNNLLEDKEALNETNSLIIFILTHGNTDERLEAGNDTFRTSDMWSIFIDCKELKNKPKMFIFQACKGNNYTTVSGDINANSTKEEKPSLVDLSYFSANLGPDMLLVFSTIEGNVSYRDALKGSWFIQELCKNFSTYGRRDDVVSLIIRTTKCICGNYYYQTTDKNPETQKQMPVFVSTLSKKFYLNRNKDRNVLLSIHKEIKEINDAINNIKSHLK